MISVAMPPVRIVDVINDHPLIECRISGKRYRRWSGFHFAQDRFSAFIFVLDQIQRDMIDALIATHMGSDYQ